MDGVVLWEARIDDDACARGKPRLAAFARAHWRWL
jgi:hypothetical protein